MLQNVQENTYVRIFFLIELLASEFKLYWKKRLQVYSCEFCKIFKDTVFKEYLQATTPNILFLSKEFMVQQSDIMRLFLSILLFFP